MSARIYTINRTKLWKVIELPSMLTMQPLWGEQVEEFGHFRAAAKATLGDDGLN
jgi:hypothetical protein